MMKLSSCFRKNVKKIPPAFLHEGIFAPRVLILMTLVIRPVFSFAGRGRRTRTLDTRFWRPLLYQLSYTPINMAEKMGFEPMLPLTNTNGLAKRPLQPLEYFSSCLINSRTTALLLIHSSVTYLSTLLPHSFACLVFREFICAKSHYLHEISYATLCPGLC